MDSSDNNELFADSGEEDVDKEQNDRFKANDPPPEYAHTMDFKTF